MYLTFLLWETIYLTQREENSRGFVVFLLTIFKGVDRIYVNRSYFTKVSTEHLCTISTGSLSSEHQFAGHVRQLITCNAICDYFGRFF